MPKYSPTNEHMTAEDASVIESAFNRGVSDGQTMEGGRQNRSRNSERTSRGLQQPVRRGTMERLHPKPKGNRR